MGMDDQEFFQLIPSEIIVDIISRLPIPTILLCKSVCKSWLDLLQSPDFVQCHLSKSRPRLIQQQIYDHRCYISEPVGLCNFIPNLPHFKNHTPPEILDLRILDPPEFKDLPMIKRPYRKIKGSVDGLLIICHEDRPTIEIMNPTTREYIQIGPSQLPGFVSGFGVSRKTREYKVIRICADKCEVYTLGTGSFVMWALKDYGDDKSWVFNSRQQLMRPPMRSICPGATFDRAGYYRLWKKIYRGGMTADPFFHCSRNRDHSVCVCGLLDRTYINMVLHNSGFLSLKSFSNERVNLI